MSKNEKYRWSFVKKWFRCIMLTILFFSIFFGCIFFLQNNIKTYVYLDKMMTNLTEKNEEKRVSYFCENCTFTCSYKSDFTRHCATRKHKMMTNDDLKRVEKETQHICSRCKRTYTTKQSLWVHKKKCTLPMRNETIFAEHLSEDSNVNPIENYILQLVKQNQEFKNMFIEQTHRYNDELVKHNNELVEIKQQNMQLQTLISAQPVQNTNITNTTNNNKTINNFNLMVFLQEKCKDALNMSQFIDTLQINPQSVEYTGTHGYVNGITKIFMDGLNQLDIHERPIHCTDLKRETLYIKDENKWEKDTEDKTRFKKALATVVNRNVAQVSHWEKENPRCQIPETDEYEFYFDIVRQSLGGGNHDVTARNNDKILRAIAGKVYLDKKTKEIQ